MSFPSGRFTLLCITYEKGMRSPIEGYVTSWDTWEECAVVFDPRMPPGFKLYDNATGRTWRPGTRHEWEEAQT